MMLFAVLAVSLVAVPTDGQVSSTSGVEELRFDLLDLAIKIAMEIGAPVPTVYFILVATQEDLEFGPYPDPETAEAHPNPSCFGTYPEPNGLETCPEPDGFGTYPEPNG
jgi:hypothetical protein